MRDLSFLQMIKRDVSHIYVYLQSTLSKTIPKETFWRMGVLIFLIPSSKCHSNTLMRYKKLYQDKYQMQILTIIFDFVGKLDQLVVKVHSCIFMLKIDKYAFKNVIQPQNHFISNNTFKMHMPYFCTIVFIAKKISHSTFNFFI